jgi:hypothetical protein
MRAPNGGNSSGRPSPKGESKMFRKMLLALVAIGAFGVGMGLNSTAQAGHGWHKGHHGHHHHHHHGHHHGHGHYHGYRGYGYGGPVVIRSYYGPRYSPYYAGYYGGYPGYGYGYPRSGFSFSIGF